MNSEESAKLARDRFILTPHTNPLGADQIKFKPTVQDKNTAVAMGVDPDNFDKIIGPPIPIKEKKFTGTILIDKIAQAEAFVQMQPIFYDRNKLWWLWDEGLSCWKMVDETDILNIVKAATPYQNTVESKLKSEILEALKQVGRKHMPSYHMDGLVQFKNGIVHHSDPTAVLVPNPSYFITNPIPWEYGPSEATPTIDFLFKSWVGEKYASTLYEITAYCLLTEYPIERIIGLLGGGSNGKSSYLYLLRRFLGMENITSTDLERLTGSNFGTASLYRKLVAIMGETNITELSQTQVIKRAVSGKDPISIEIKGKMPFDTINYAKIIMATNSLPATMDKTDGFYRKWLLVDFPNQFKEGKNPVYSVPDEEFSNLGRKCLVILKNLLERQAFTNEGGIDDRRARYEERSNPFDKFWEEFVEQEFAEGIAITKNDFKNKLNQWLIEKRHRPMSDLTISQKLGYKGIEEVRINMEINGQTIRPRAWACIKWKKGGSLSTLSTLST